MDGSVCFFPGRWLGYGIKMESFTYLESRCHAHCRASGVQDLNQFIAGGSAPPAVMKTLTCGGGSFLILRKKMQFYEAILERYPTVTPRNDRGHCKLI